MLTGRIIISEFIQKQVKYLFLLFFLAVGYIGYRYKIENTVRENKKLAEEIKTLHAEYITKSIELVRVSKRSEIGEQIKNRKITVKEQQIPPKRINVNK